MFKWFSRRIVVLAPLLARDTIDEKILQLQTNKKALSNSFLSVDSSFTRGLTSEDLNFILS